MKTEEVEEAAGSSAAPAEHAERAEVLEALRRALASLSGLDRQLVALSCLAGLTHEEIAKDVQMPKRTVSYRIQKALESMQVGLTSAGYSAVAPLLAPQLLCEVSGSGHRVPATLRERVLAGLDRPVHGLASQARSARQALPAASRAGGLAIGVAVLGLAAVVGGWLYFSAPSKERAELAPETQPGSAAIATVPSAPAAQTPAASGWEPVPISPFVEYFQDTNQAPESEPSAERPGKNKVRFMMNTGDGKHWQMRSTAEGTEVAYTEPGPSEMRILFLGQTETGAREWTALLDYAGAAPEGTVCFMLSNPGQFGNMFARHFATGQPSAIRIVAWPVAGGIRVASLRKTADGKLFAGAEEVASADGKFNLGLSVTTKMTFRQFRYRRLPADWSPEKDPMLRNSNFSKDATHGTR